MSPAYAVSKDQNHDEIRAYCEGLGWRWIDTYQHAQYTPGFSDGIAICPYATVFVEVKSGPNARLTEDEQDFRDAVLAAGGNYCVIRDYDDVVAMTREKTTPEGYEEGYGIINVPTFIFYRGEGELGRIVEYPIESMEADMVKILSGLPYRHAYDWD